MVRSTALIVQIPSLIAVLFLTSPQNVFCIDMDIDLLAVESRHSETQGVYMVTSESPDHTGSDEQLTGLNDRGKGRIDTRMIEQPALTSKNYDAYAASKKLSKGEIYKEKKPLGNKTSTKSKTILPRLTKIKKSFHPSPKYNVAAAFSTIKKIPTQKPKELNNRRNTHNNSNMFSSNAHISPHHNKPSEIHAKQEGQESKNQYAANNSNRKINRNIASKRNDAQLNQKPASSVARHVINQNGELVQLHVSADPKSHYKMHSNQPLILKKTYLQPNSIPQNQYHHSKKLPQQLTGQPKERHPRDHRYYDQENQENHNPHHRDEHHHHPEESNRHNDHRERNDDDRNDDDRNHETSKSLNEKDENPFHNDDEFFSFEPIQHDESPLHHREDDDSTQHRQRDNHEDDHPRNSNNDNHDDDRQHSHDHDDDRQHSHDHDDDRQHSHDHDDANDPYHNAIDHSDRKQKSPSHHDERYPSPNSHDDDYHPDDDFHERDNRHHQKSDSQRNERYPMDHEEDHNALNEYGQHSHRDDDDRDPPQEDNREDDDHHHHDDESAPEPHHDERTHGPHEHHDDSDHPEEENNQHHNHRKEPSENNEQQHPNIPIDGGFDELYPEVHDFEPEEGNLAHAIRDKSGSENHLSDPYDDPYFTLKYEPGSKDDPKVKAKLAEEQRIAQENRDERYPVEESRAEEAPNEEQSPTQEERNQHPTQNNHNEIHDDDDDDDENFNPHQTFEDPHTDHSIRDSHHPNNRIENQEQTPPNQYSQSQIPVNHNLNRNPNQGGHYYPHAKINKYPSQVISQYSVNHIPIQRQNQHRGHGYNHAQQVTRRPHPLANQNLYQTSSVVGNHAHQHKEKDQHHYLQFPQNKIVYTQLPVVSHNNQPHKPLVIDVGTPNGIHSTSAVPQPVYISAYQNGHNNGVNNKQQQYLQSQQSSKYEPSQNHVKNNNSTKRNKKQQTDLNHPGHSNKHHNRKSLKHFLPSLKFPPPELVARLKSPSSKNSQSQEKSSLHKNSPSHQNSPTPQYQNSEKVYEQSEETSTENIPYNRQASGLVHSRSSQSQSFEGLGKVMIPDFESFGSFNPVVQSDLHD